MPQIEALIRRRATGFLTAFAVALAAVAAPARADEVACQRYKAELSSLNGGGSGQRALKTEIGRLESYYRSLNCEGGRFLFIDTRPPQCAAIEQRIKALNAGYGVENGEVVAARRRQLIAAIGVACSTATGEDGLPVAQSARGGGRVICVKTCDGSYFPMNNLPDGRGGADELCQALCPGAEALAYSMPHGDDALKYAATIKGNRAYAALKTAFRFRTRFEPNCTCKREGQGWAQSLAKAESLLFRHKGDIFVTPMQAERLSRPPKVRLTLVGRADRTAAGLAADAATRSGVPIAAGEAGAPAAQRTALSATPASEGWQDPRPGPRTTEERPSERPGERPGVRVIAPAMIPVPARTVTP